MTATLTRGKFIPTSKTNPCPICGDTKGKCRHHSSDPNYVHCHTHAGTRKGEKVGNWVCIDDKHRGHTSGFRLDENKPQDSFNRDEWAKRKLERKRKLEAAEKERLGAIAQKSLPPKIRHKLYTKILGDLGLDLRTIDDLTRRGYDQEEIKRSGFKSVTRWQRINISALAKKLGVKPNQLPGVNKSGNGLLIGESGGGYLCPIRNYEGLIIGMQFRRHKPSDDRGRYGWCSGGNATLHLPNGELPIGVFHPSGKPEGIAVIEGVGAKPFYCAERLNYLTIGAAGGQHLNSPEQLKESIDAATAQHGNIPLVVILDSGWVLNKQVKGKAISLFSWLRTHYPNHEIKVPDWNQIHKSAGDIDEIGSGIKVRALKLESFLAKYQAVFGESAKGELHASKQFEKWAEARVKLTADEKVDQRWLKIEPRWKDQADIIMIRSGLGTGKTEALLNFLAAYPELVSLLVGYRNSLLRNTIKRANSPRLGDDGKPVRRAIAADHIKNLIQNGINMGMDASIRLWSGCADSFHKLDRILSELNEYLLIHDEICSVLSHLKTGGTLKGNQQKAIDWDMQAIENATLTIMMDANLSDTEVSFVRKLYPHKRIMVVDNEYKDKSLAKDFIFLETKDKKGNGFSRNPKKLPVQLVEVAKKAGRVLWISDSQVSCEVADETLTKIGHQHFRLDRKTSKDELSEQFQEDPAYFLVDGNYDSASLSPSGESGLSIDFNDPRIIDLIQSKHYFDAVCFDVRGTIGVNALVQLSARLRDVNVPIYVSCPDFINLTSNPVPGGTDNLAKVMTERFINFQKLAIEEERQLSDKEIGDEMGKVIADQLWFTQSLKDSAQISFEHKNLKLCLKTALAQSGHRIHDLVGDVTKHDEDTHKQNKELVKDRESEKIYNARDLTWEQSQLLDAKDVGYNDQCAIKKAKLKHELPGIENSMAWSPELIRAFMDNRSWIENQKQLMQAPDKDLVKAVFLTTKKNSIENGFSLGEIYYDKRIRTEALVELGVLKLLEMTSISAKNPEVRAIVDRYYDEPEFYDLIGISKAKKSETGSHYKKMVERFLGCFGFELELVKKTKTERSYAKCYPAKIQPFIGDILVSLNRWKETTLQEAENIDLSGGTFSDLIYKKEIKKVPPILVVSDDKEKNNMQKVEYSDTHSGWNTPQSISEVAGYLEQCDDAEALALLRQCEIPPAIFKLAARRLSPAKQRQIREWVEVQNRSAA